MMKRQDMHGIIVPVVTPFRSDGGLDLESYRNYAGRLITHDIQGLIINGTTGESPTVAWEEAEQLTKLTFELMDGKSSVPVIIGTGTNDTYSTMKRTENAAKLGADAVLVVVPYYSKPSQEGIIKHFEKVAEVGIPVIAYEIPSRTGIRLSVDTARRILDMEGVIGMKDSSDSLELTAELTRLGAGPLLCGDDLQFHAKLSQGASGGILASANMNTQRFIDVYNMAAGGDLKAAKHSFDTLVPLIRTCFRESNPAPLKRILALKGIIASDQLRLPMTPVSEEFGMELVRMLEDLI
ncbi:4-hydroxy-tetrahydrodipicolinate synthase [Paenibacillus sp. HJL G12]|uniref:4-hydroxy-tetrahydrodipicolinate synthase n=1 Tax=Paenibacillus dendrobii TaxID=2691084 RepID=A0A7X3LFM0_9BACL|nr:4-hydroxy-tetrahydrodipicolinate synthase [Paenibacillus dendrobii]MWV43147.1 4-hydroxy-tetrahydrodipicolinate synthase [Paenibacillus dendrobii]